MSLFRLIPIYAVRVRTNCGIYMKQVFKVIGMLAAIIGLVLFLSIFVFDFFLALFNATRWECKKYDTVQTTWVDYDQNPTTVKYQKQPVCIVWERGK
jgi:hypothetical protein